MPQRHMRMHQLRRFAPKTIWIALKFLVLVPQLLIQLLPASRDSLRVEHSPATAVKELDMVGDVIIVSMDRDDGTLKFIEDGTI